MICISPNIVLIIVWENFHKSSNIIIIIIRKLIVKAMHLRTLAPDQVKTETLAFCIYCQSYLGPNHIHSGITYVIRLIYTSTAMMMIIVSGEQDVTVPVSKGTATTLAWTSNLGPGYLSGATIITMVMLMLMDIIM